MNATMGPSIRAKPVRETVARTRTRLVLRSILPFVVSTPRKEPSTPRCASTTLPSILVVSIPKSGTVFTNLMLSRGLLLEQASVSFGYFPHYLVEIPKLVSFVKGGKVAPAHFDPSAVNLQSLTPFIKRWVLHIRDPRSVVLSWVHHTNRIYSERHNGEHQHFVMRGGKSVIGNTAPYRSPVPDLGRYEGREGPDEYGHRMMVNAAAFAFTSLLAIAGVWLAMMMVHA